MKWTGEAESAPTSERTGGLAVWLLDRLRRGRRAEPRLTLLDRITLAPRQSLALVEAEGRRLLVATSAAGAPTFYALDEDNFSTRQAHRSPSAISAGRISW
jgi:flagellar biogenesis protein FliO